MSETEKKQISEQEETKNEQIREMGQILLEENRQNYRIHHAKYHWRSRGA